MTKVRVLAGMLIIGAALLVGSVHEIAAEAYPSRVIKLIVPFPPGGGVDVIARAVSEKLSERLGQPIVIENRPGASGSIGAREVGKSAPDGYTLLVHATVIGMYPLVYSNLGYDPFEDFAPIATLATQPLVLFLNGKSKISSVNDIVRQAKEKPGAIMFAGIGMASPQHMAGELFMYRTKTQLTHVPYKGTAPAITDLIAGQVQLGFLGLSSGMPYVQSGQLKALAVASRKRTSLFPALSTMAEVGVADFEVGITYFMAAPAKTPQGIVQKLSAEVAEVLKDESVVQALARQGYEPLVSSPAEVTAMMREENEKWAPIVNTRGIKVE